MPMGVGSIRILGGSQPFPSPPSHSPPLTLPSIPHPSRVRRAPRRVRRGLPLGRGSGGFSPGKFLKIYIAVREFYSISENLKKENMFQGKSLTVRKY
jgi:hypothetical protein